MARIVYNSHSFWGIHDFRGATANRAILMGEHAPWFNCMDALVLVALEEWNIEARDAALPVEKGLYLSVAAFCK